MVEQKIERLIEEAFMQKVKQLLKKIKPIPNTILDKIKQKFKIPKVLEETKVMPAPKIEGMTNMTDTCYTAVMKLINKPGLIKKYPSLYEFLEAYKKKGGELIPVKNIGVDNLKPGTITIIHSENKLKYIANRGFGPHGLISQRESSGGHMGIYMGKEKISRPNKYLVLHNTWIDSEINHPGADLQLVLERKTKQQLQKDKIKALDYQIIEKM